MTVADGVATIACPDRTENRMVRVPLGTSSSRSTSGNPARVCPATMVIVDVAKQGRRPAQRREGAYRRGDRDPQGGDPREGHDQRQTPTDLPGLLREVRERKRQLHAASRFQRSHADQEAIGPGCCGEDRDPTS